MARIIGSIDNAAIWNTQYHLIFTEKEILQFELMSGKEWRSDLYATQMSNRMRMVPIAGQATTYNVTREELERLVEQNAERGRDIERDIDNIIKERTHEFTSIEYAAIDNVELSNGTPVTLPHLIIHSKSKKLKFHLIRNSYRGKGKLPDDIFGSYENTLKEAFGDLLKVKA